MYSQVKPTKYMTEGLAKEQELLELYQHKQAECGRDCLKVSQCAWLCYKPD
mgnify:CR=1 FL=1